MSDIGGCGSIGGDECGCIFGFEDEDSAGCMGGGISGNYGDGGECTILKILEQQLQKEKLGSCIY